MPAGPPASAVDGSRHTWLDLFEWWAIHRQTAEGDLGGGWTDDVEIVPAFALSAFVIEDASHLAGSQLTLHGRYFRPGLTALEAQAPTTDFGAAFVGDTRAVLTLALTAPDGTVLVSAANPDGRQSNVLPLRVRALPRFTLPAQTSASLRTEGFRFRLTGSLNQFYIIEQSADLEDWQPLTTNQYLGLPLDLLNPGATHAPMRFYRARPAE